MAHNITFQTRACCKTNGRRSLSTWILSAPNVVRTTYYFDGFHILLTCHILDIIRRSVYRNEINTFFSAMIRAQSVFKLLPPPRQRHCEMVGFLRLATDLFILLYFKDVYR